MGGGAVDDDAGGFVGGEKIRRGGAEKGGKAVQAGVHGAEFVEEVFQGEGADAALDGGGAGGADFFAVMIQGILEIVEACGGDALVGERGGIHGTGGGVLVACGLRAHTGRRAGIGGEACEGHFGSSLGWVGSYAAECCDS